jgi:ectoine hydroxylase
MSAIRIDVDAAVAQLEAEGYVVLEDVLPPSMVDELLAAANELYGRSPKIVGVEPLHSLDAYQQDARIAELLTWQQTLDVVRAALSDNICVYHSHLDIHPPHGHRIYHWHQDIDFVTRDCGRLRAPLCVKVGFFLGDVPSPEYGAMRVQPRTHAGVQFDRTSDGIPVELSAGSAIVLDHRLWHSRGLNTSAVTRAAFFVAYAYRWVRRRDELESLPSASDGLGETVRALLEILPPEGATVAGCR